MRMHAPASREKALFNLPLASGRVAVTTLQAGMVWVLGLLQAPGVAWAQAAPALASTDRAPSAQAGSPAEKPHDQLDRSEPTNFIGQAGFRFEFSSVRKGDDVQIKGIG